MGAPGPLSSRSSPPELGPPGRVGPEGAVVLAVAAVRADEGCGQGESDECEDEHERHDWPPELNSLAEWIGRGPSVGLIGSCRKSQFKDNGCMKRSISTRDLARLMATWQSVDAGSAYERLAAGIRAAILDGRIPVGARLPAER